MSSPGERGEDEAGGRYTDFLTTSRRMPGSYYSPISGFLQLPEEEAAYHTSTDSGPTTDEQGHEDFEDRSSLMKAKLGLREVPPQQLANKLSKHTSTQTLRAELETVSDLNNDNFDLDWDNDSQTEAATAAPIQTHASNTWSASSKAARSISHALKYSDDVQPSSPTILSCSLPNPNHMPQNIVRESWDDDFLFQDPAEEQKSSEPSMSNRVKSKNSSGRGSLEKDEEDEEDWGAASSMEKESSISLATTSSALPASRIDGVPLDSSHLEQIRHDSRDRSAAAGPSLLRRPSIPQSRIARLSIATTGSDAGPFFRDKFAARTDKSIHHFATKDSLVSERWQEQSSVANSSRRQAIEVKKSPTTSGRTTPDETIKVLPRSTARSSSETVLKSISDSPAKVQARHSEGHWSHFLSSKLNQAKSPEKENRKSKPVKDHGNSTVPGIKPLRTSSPPVSPSAVRSRELSKSKAKLINGEASSHGRVSHRRGGTSLSMSFGLMTPWGWHNRSSQRVNDTIGSLAGASTSSVSLASITADTGRSAGDMVRGDDTRQGRSADDMLDVYKQSSLSYGPVQRSNSRVNKRKPDGQGNRSLEENEVQATVCTAVEPLPREIRSRMQASTRSPSSYRAPLMSLSTRSHSGSASTATTAMSSSDCTTSAGSMTEESTLYGSVDDACKMLPNIDSSSYFVPVATPLMRRTVTSDAIAPRSAEKAATSARRIRVSTSRTATAIDNTLDSIKPIRSPIEAQFRLPSDPLYTTTLTSKERDSTEQGGPFKSGDTFVRRSSLSDLRIPSRITKAQESIRTNMNRVKDFANGIEELKALREQYQSRLREYTATDSRRLGVEEEYGSWWECVEVLIGLGHGKGGHDDEANVDTLDLIQPFSTSPSNMPSSMLVQNAARTTNPAVSSGSDQAATKSLTGARPPSSRASSSRSVDPQREIDILSAMLAGTPLEDFSPVRPEMLQRERTLSGNEGQFATEGKSGSSNMRQHDAKGQLPLARTSTTSLSFANADASHHRSRSRSHRPSASVSKSAYFQQRRDAAQSSSLYSNGTGSSTVILGALSTESVDTQGATRKMRLRDTGKAGLQGLKELLRIFKINSSALAYHGEANQSKVSLTRTLTDEPRISFENRRLSADANADEENKSTPMSRTRSLISKTMTRSTSHSPALQRRSLSINVEDSHLSSRSSSITSSQDRSASILSRSVRMSSGGESSTKDTSLDSEWTQGDFDQLDTEDLNPNTRPEVSFDGPDVLSAKSSAGKRRFFLFSKGFPPSAARRHSKDVLHWASSSKESFDLSPTRHSLQLPARESLQSSGQSFSPGGMPRANSSAKHPLLSTRADTNRRSISSSSSLASPTSKPLFIDLNATVRPSKGSSTATVSTIESNGSDGTQIATPNTEATNNTHRKLALKPEAIPSLLVYLEATKARCRESLALLQQNAVHLQ